MPSIASENGDTAAIDDTKAAADTQTDEIDAEQEQEAESSELGEDEDSEEESEDDEEPTLKYSRLPIPPELLERDNASTLAVSTRFLAIGTHGGGVIVSDYDGHIAKKFKPHTASVLGLSIDSGSEFVASASMDGHVAIVSLGDADSHVFDTGRPLRAIALEPDFGKSRTRQFVCGGLSGALVLHERGWLGHKEVTIHSGEGPIWAISWIDNLIAWVNDEGVRIYDVRSGTKISYIAKPANAPRVDLFKCSLHWQDSRTLLIGWADYIKVATLKEKERSRATQLGSAVVPTSHSNLHAEITAIFQVDCMISGIIPFRKDAYIILAYLTELSTQEEASQKRRQAQRPELRVIAHEGEELSSDALSLSAYEKYQCNDYTLIPAPEKEIFYVLSPKDIVVAKPRDESDHIAWLVEKRRYEEALKAVEDSGMAGVLDGYDVGEIGTKYLQHLVAEGEYAKAAETCPKILGSNVKAWEDWVFLFIEKGQIQTIIPYVPTHDPQLDRVVYEMVLAHFLRHDHLALLRTIRTWPHTIYDKHTVILAIEGALDSLREQYTLMECLADLYIANRQPGKALPYFLRLRRPGVFDLVRDNNLFTDVQDQAVLLLDFDRDISKKQGKQPAKEGHPTHTISRHGDAIDLLTEHTHSIPIPRVVKQLKGHRQYLYQYLDALFEKDPTLAAEYSDFQVDLYAEYEYPRLMDFLRTSNYYALEKAYESCTKRDLVPEMVFLLGRMGNNKKALGLIIERMGDVQRAIDFAKEQNDADLWEDLLKYSESRPTFIRGLLENVGSEIDPVNLIRRIKDGLEIPGLKGALIKILQDFNLQISLMEGCESILYSDCRQLSSRLHRGQTRAFSCTPATNCDECNTQLFDQSLRPNAPSTRAVVVMFLCRHIYHAGCAFPSAEPNLPSRPEHALSAANSLIGSDKKTTNFDGQFRSRTRFVADLQTQVKTVCPQCEQKAKLGVGR